MSRVRRSSLIRENLIIAWDVLSSHKLRSGLIILGVCIGVAALMGMVSILAGLGEKITHDIHSSEQTVVIVMKFDVFVGGFDESMLHRKEITEEDAFLRTRQCRSFASCSFLSVLISIRHGGCRGLQIHSY